MTMNERMNVENSEHNDNKIVERTLVPSPTPARINSVRRGTSSGRTVSSTYCTHCHSNRSSAAETQSVNSVRLWCRHLTDVLH